jgi:hypothetical protein
MFPLNSGRFHPFRPTQGDTCLTTINCAQFRKTCYKRIFASYNAHLSASLYALPGCVKESSVLKRAGLQMLFRQSAGTKDRGPWVAPFFLLKERALRRLLLITKREPSISCGSSMFSVYATVASQLSQAAVTSSCHKQLSQAAVTSSCHKQLSQASCHKQLSQAAVTSSRHEQPSRAALVDVEHLAELG